MCLLRPSQANNGNLSSLTGPLEGAAGAPPASCWHELTVIPLLDPVLDTRVLLITQTGEGAKIQMIQNSKGSKDLKGRFWFFSSSSHRQV